MNERIKQIREAKGLTQGQLAEAIGVTRNYVAIMESGARNPSDRTVAEICRIYHINEEWLRTGEGDMNVDVSIEEELIEIFATHFKDESEMAKKKKALIHTLLRLDEGSMEVLANIAEDWVKNMK